MGDHLKMVDDLSASLPPFSWIIWNWLTPDMEPAWVSLQYYLYISIQKYIFQPSGFDHRQRIVAHRSDTMKCQHNEPTPYSHSTSLFKLQHLFTFFLILDNRISVRWSALKSYGDIIFHSFFPCLPARGFVVSCSTPLWGKHQTLNAKRQTQNPTFTSRRSHSK